MLGESGVFELGLFILFVLFFVGIAVVAVSRGSIVLLVARIGRDVGFACAGSRGNGGGWIALREVACDRVFFVRVFLVITPRGRCFRHG